MPLWRDLQLAAPRRSLLPSAPARSARLVARPLRATLAVLALLGLLAALFLILAQPATAQEFTLDLGEGDSLAARSVQLLLLITVLSVVPGLAVMITCFPFIVTVLSILRQGIGLQSAPPNMVLISLAMFLTWYVMDPVFTEAWERGIGPFSRNEMEIATAFTEASQPFRAFMTARMDPDTFATLDALRPRDPTPIVEAPLSVLVPSFLLSEIQRAFEIGFLVFLPFLIIDLVVSAILMSMGMMMVPPAVVSLPFKLAFFVVADGWSLLAAALVRSYGV
jgi:flagellar biosynthetic protein FliP